MSDNLQMTQEGRKYMASQKAKQEGKHEYKDCSMCATDCDWPDGYNCHRYTERPKSLTIEELTAQLEASQNARKIAESDLANLKSMIAATPNGCKVIDAAMARISVLQGDRPSVSLAAYEAVSQAMYKMEKERDQWKKTAENAANEFMLEQKLHNETGLKLEASRKEAVKLREDLQRAQQVFYDATGAHLECKSLAPTTADPVWEHNFMVRKMMELPVAAWKFEEAVPAYCNEKGTCTTAGNKRLLSFTQPDFTDENIHHTVTLVAIPELKEVKE